MTAVTTTFAPARALVRPAFTLLAALLAGGCFADRDRHAYPPKHIATISGSVLQDRWKGYVSEVPKGTTRLVVELHDLSQDADLYIQGPRRREYCESFRPGRRSERCVFDYPTAGTWSIEVAGWDPGRTYYRLTSRLSPSDRRVSLWLADQGVVALASHGEIAASVEAAAEHLGLLRRLTDAALDAGSGEHALLVMDGTDVTGHAHATVSEENGVRKLAFRMAVASPTDEGRHYISTRAGHPLVLDAINVAPASGLINLRIGDSDVLLRLGIDTGTGAVTQFVAQPGPVVRERRWPEAPGSTLAIKPAPPDHAGPEG